MTGTEPLVLYHWATRDKLLAFILAAWNLVWMKDLCRLRGCCPAALSIICQFTPTALPVIRPDSPLYWLSSDICLEIYRVFRKERESGTGKFEFIHTNYCIGINLHLFFYRPPSNGRLFLSCGPFVVITTKGLQDRNNLLLDGGRWTEIFPSVQKHDI